MRLIILIWITTLISFGDTLAQKATVFKVVQSTLSFHSTAPEELISAQSKSLKGIIDFKKGTFVFKVKMQTFDGFNNSLQKEHFNENYVESHIFPEATYEGKIIESVDLEKNNTCTVRTKGKFYIHGISKECIVLVKLNIKEQRIDLSTNFELKLPDYAIKIPKVVNNKLASVINVQLQARLDPI